MFDQTVTAEQAGCKLDEVIRHFMPMQIVDEPALLCTGIDPAQIVNDLFVIQMMGKQGADDDVERLISLEVENIGAFMTDQ